MVRTRVYAIFDALADFAKTRSQTNASLMVTVHLRSERRARSNVNHLRHLCYNIISAQLMCHTVARCQHLKHFETSSICRSLPKRYAIKGDCDMMHVCMYMNNAANMDVVYIAIVVAMINNAKQRHVDDSDNMLHNSG
jgi:hypothetical protein